MAGLPVFQTIIPLTTVFTPPADCRQSWTYESGSVNGVTGGLLLQNALTDPVDTSCFPPGHSWGFRNVNNAQVWSPGACPAGYTTPAALQQDGTTMAVCCPSGFNYTTTRAPQNLPDGGDPATILQAGCVSLLPTGAVTSVAARDGHAYRLAARAATVTGPVTMWGQALTVQYRDVDRTLFPAATAGAAPTTVAAATPLAVPPAVASVTPGATPAPPPAPAGATTGLSAAGGAGVALGVCAALAALGAGLALLLRRRRRRRRREELQVQELGGPARGAGRLQLVSEMAAAGPRRLQERLKGGGSAAGSSAGTTPWGSGSAGGAVGARPSELDSTARHQL